MKKIFILTMIFLTGCSATISDTKAEPLSSQKENISNESIEDDFIFTSFEGEEILFSDWQQKPTVVNFYASWCPSCIAEMPDFEVVFQNVKTDVNFLGLAMQDDPKNALKLVDATGITYETGLDNEGAIFEQFQSLGMPTTLFFNENGIMIESHTGQLNVESLTNKIDMLFNN